MKLKVHLLFAGRAEEAFFFYKNTFGGEIVFSLRYKEDKDEVVEECDKEKISHIILKTSHFDIAGQDVISGRKLIMGNNNQLVVEFTTLVECKRIFDIFARKGNVTIPFDKTFFSEGFGEVTDEFGIPWIFLVSE